jgi:hypothetical protein
MDDNWGLALSLRLCNETVSGRYQKEAKYLPPLPLGRAYFSLPDVLSHGIKRDALARDWRRKPLFVCPDSESGYTLRT